ncbi:YqaA family protein [Pseudoroseomonas cervicalis]|uniref:YqaA family protein n=1 Tax=Teichococcus cervicalis TaxID=204525 RepID=UPI00278425E4|nr:YqaA family protein [Pseudoroseomonas cervicalis]MDQ1079039.1 membrane protein YqaA with SNARE-associated domain [Pseudoroseomonas cervicalis]
MLHALYERILRLAAHRHAGRWLAAISFAESSVFPIPPDAMLLPMCLARPERAWRYAAICTIASVLGGIAGYALGYFLFEAVAQPVLAAYGHAEALQSFRAWFDRWGAAVILIKGLTPIPYKVVTIAAGAAAFDPWVFLLASIVTRGARFFLLAALLRRYGAPVRGFVEKRLTLLTTLAAIAILGGIAAIRLI